jgi:FAD/FMN-containing dehydrogenase/Fe-S oxidoreductase
VSLPPFHLLRNRLRGELHTDAVRRSLLSTDGSIFQVTPAAVVYPRDAEDVAETVRFAREHRVPIHARGAGSGLCGSAVGPGIVVDFTKFMNRLLELDLENRTFTCEPGYRFGELQARLKTEGLFFPPDPSSGEYATFGGMAGTNASGAHSVKYGNVADYLEDAELVTGDGRTIHLSEIRETRISDLPENLRAIAELYGEHETEIAAAYPETRFNTAGYNLRNLVRSDRLDLRRLIVGAEGTLGVATRLTFRLLPKPERDTLVVAFMDDIVASARAVQAILPMGPSGIEIMDRSLLRLARSEAPALRSAIPANVDNILLVEFDDPDCVENARTAREMLASGGFTDRVHMAVTPAEKADFWGVRKAAVPILYRLTGERKILALIEDAAVPTDQLVEYFEGIYRILGNHGVDFVTYGHIAKGLLHTRPLLNLKDPADVERLRLIADDFFDLVHGLGGAVSGEHGDGRLRSAYIRRQYPTISPLFSQVKSLLDPAGIFNPEIITRHDPDQMGRNLRFGPDYSARPPVRKTALEWPEGLSRTVETCHGCSKCTTVTDATRMCPVFKATRDEADAPKAKANLLRNLTAGRLANHSLFDAAVRDVISRCIGCRSCLRECPSRVNIPKLTMEVRAAHARRFGVSPADRLLTAAEPAGRHLRKLAAAAGPVAEAPRLRALGERLTGIAANRPLPAFAGRELRERLGAEAVAEPNPVSRRERGHPRVLFFAGCAARYLTPEVGEAAVRLMRAAGMAVTVPEQHCCGLPMLAKGMAGTARERMAGNLARWDSLLRDVDFVAVTCSSCGLALREEWRYLSDSPLVRSVGERVISASRLLLEYRDRLAFRGDAGRLAYHAPCHLRGTEDDGASLALLRALPGAEVIDLSAGCCGMAGSWGMKAENMELSREIGSDLMRKLAVSGADVAATDCPTCRMQMEGMSGGVVKHPMEMVKTMKWLDGLDI